MPDPNCCNTASRQKRFPAEDNGLLVIKMMVFLAQLSGTVQYIQQLEVNSKSATKFTAVPNQKSVSFLIYLIKAASVVTSLGGGRVNLPSQFVLSRLILDEKSNGGKKLCT